MHEAALLKVFNKFEGHCHFCGDEIDFDKRGWASDLNRHWEADHVTLPRFRGRVGSDESELRTSPPWSGAKGSVEKRSDVDLIVLVDLCAAPKCFLLAHAIGTLLAGARTVDATPADASASNLASTEHADHFL